MLNNKHQKLELTWIGKGEEPRLEPRILIEDPAYSYGSRDNDNMLIHGDNLLALKALEQDYAGKIKCIYIDPPYNTGSAFEHYDDGVEHSTWLNLMKPRLDILKELLSENGCLWISIDDNECHYLKVMCDEIFGRKNFIANIIWEKRLTRENRRKFSFNHDHILLFAKDKSKFEDSMNSLPFSDEAKDRYSNRDNDPRGLWQSIPMLAQTGHATASQFYTITTPSGKKINPPSGNCWRYTEIRFKEEFAKGNIFFTKNGDGVPRIKKFLTENTGLTPETIWTAKEVETNDSAKKHTVQIFKELGDNVFDTPKPEQLIERILQLSSNPGDIILDSFLGSGTTAAVAHKMGRNYIGIELGEHARTHCYPRLKAVVQGEQGGISKIVDWKGGGGFKFYTLAPSLLKRDEHNQYVIEPSYNADMLAAAMAKQEGYAYSPNEEIYWKQGRSSEKDYIYTTTQFMSPEQLDGIHAAMKTDESLLITCTNFKKECKGRYPNISIKKIPQMLLGRCDFDHDDYSLHIVDMPVDETPIDYLKIEEPATESKKSTDDQPSLF